MILFVCLESHAKEIPLDEIWAYRMPGTKDVRKLDRVKKGTLFESPTVQSILFALSKRPEKAGPSFVVPGTYKEALLNADRAFNNGEPEPVTASDDITLVFFSEEHGTRYVHVKSVEQSGNVFTISYQFVSHMSAESTKHFALIPLGKRYRPTNSVNASSVELRRFE